MLDSVEFDDPLDEIMAANELVPFILHNYIANIAVDLITLATIANNCLIRFVLKEKQKISVENLQESTSTTSEIERAYYRYFGSLITVFKLSYEYYCQVMKHDSTTIVGLLDKISNCFSQEANKPKKLIENISVLKKLLVDVFNRTNEQMDDIFKDSLKLTIKDLVRMVEKINFRLLSLAESIKVFKPDI